eukprot:Seg4174.3 transcript_id=Seg4174.3/GoldUCD/mRNA.D3Y31 product="hypothetical protein" protein_id=Seg4174.3/GoldUCD/D3Y31
MNPYVSTGAKKDFFELSKYKDEVGKDYKRITFYLCEECDYTMSENMEQGLVLQPDISPDSYFKDDPTFGNDTLLDGLISEQSPEHFTSTSKDAIGQLQVDIPVSQTPVYQGTQKVNKDHVSHIQTQDDILKDLASKVNENEQFFLVSRRGAPLSRIVSLWQRGSAKSKPTSRLRVHFSGEDGIDSGAIAAEFLENCRDDMSKEMFPEGSPIHSSHNVQNGAFRTCGEIVAASLAQGGPAPKFLEPCSYEAMINEVDMCNIQDEHLTKSELKLVADIAKDCTNYSDLIIDCGYTGVVDENHVNDIIRSMKVSFVARRKIYMQEFMVGMDLYGLADLIKVQPALCMSLFVIRDSDDVNANYLFSLLKPNLSKKGTSRRAVEEQMMDFMQDLIFSFEDKQISGHEAAFAWNYQHVDEQIPEFLQLANDLPIVDTEQMQSASADVKGLMGWLTGMKSKPISGFKPEISVMFDHDCMEKNPSHSICYPVVGACGRTITLPVHHMNTEKDFNEVFTTAFFMGQAFGKP